MNEYELWMKMSEYEGIWIKMKVILIWSKIWNECNTNINVILSIWMECESNSNIYVILEWIMNMTVKD